VQIATLAARGRINLARPDGNITGIANLFGSIGGKWLELLKEAAPTVERVAYLVGVSPESLISPEYYFPQIQEAARVLGVKVLEIRYRNSVDLVRAIDAFAAAQNSGLIVGPASLPTPEGVFAAAAAVLDACHRSLLCIRVSTAYKGRSTSCGTAASGWGDIAKEKPARGVIRELPMNRHCSAASTALKR
jgi:ABC-type uncharacterized transport system substrate-binding protein